MIYEIVAPHFTQTENVPTAALSVAWLIIAHGHGGGSVFAVFKRNGREVRDAFPTACHPSTMSA